MSRMLFINLPVSDMERSKRFYEAIGARNEPKFSNEHGSMMRFSDQIAVMLLTHDFYRTFTAKPVADAHAASQVLLCISCDNPAAVDAMVDAAAASGGKADPGPKQTIGSRCGWTRAPLSREQLRSSRSERRRPEGWTWNGGRLCRSTDAYDPFRT